MKAFARIGAVLAASLAPTIASAQLHVGGMPSDEQLMFHMHAITGCVGNGGTIYAMVGKYESRVDEWVIYYQYENPDGSRYFAYNAYLRRLDTARWILACTTQDGTEQAHIVEPLAAAEPAPAEPVAPPPADAPADKPAPG
jgi:hypothetical protein